MGPYREALQQSVRLPESLYQGDQEWQHLDPSGEQAQEKPCSTISALEGQKIHCSHQLSYSPRADFSLLSRELQEKALQLFGQRRWDGPKDR